MTWLIFLDYNYTIRDSKSPLVNVGSGDREILVPAELCHVVPGQPARMKLPIDATTKMVAVACRNPADNARLIVGEGVRVLGVGADAKGGPVRCSSLWCQ